MTGKVPRRVVDGVLLLDKHAGISSTTAVGWVRRLFHAAKAGHTGTLDPFATGLLPICLGEASKFARFMLDAEKGYLATLRLGHTSTTGDTEGEIVPSHGPLPTRADVERVLQQFRGALTQLPPMHSALKQDGVALYKLARQGIEVPRERRNIQVSALEIESLDGETLVLAARVSKGTYVRVLAADIGDALGCGGYLTGLRRTSTGGFQVEQSHTLESLEPLEPSARDSLLLPPDSLALGLPALQLDALQSVALTNGQVPTVVVSGVTQDTCRVYDPERQFLGVATLSEREGETARVTALRLMAT